MEYQYNHQGFHFECQYDLQGRKLFYGKIKYYWGFKIFIRIFKSKILN